MTTIVGTAHSDMCRHVDMMISRMLCSVAVMIVALTVSCDLCAAEGHVIAMYFAALSKLKRMECYITACGPGLSTIAHHNNDADLAPH